MLHFLNGVRVIQVLGDGTPAPKSDESDEEGTTTEISSANGKVVIHKHHNDGVPFTVVPVVAIFFTFAYLIVKAIMAPFTNRNRQAQAVSAGGLSEEEVAILHKLQRTLSQMESRVEALETILIDQSRTAKNYGPKF